jgi:PhnB protein
MKIMFSDGAPHKKITQGTNIQLNIEFSDPDKTEIIFNKLAEGGKITMPLEITFWNAKFGMLEDKFGIVWMVNCSMNQEN